MLRRVHALLAAAGLACTFVAGAPAAAPSRPAFALTVTQRVRAIHRSFQARPSWCAVRRGPNSYPWPVKPFDVQHPIRAFFGDPRTIFLNESSAAAGTFSFHNGVDIAAPDGTAVYPVLSGVVTTVKPDEIIVSTTSRRRTFQYWHLAPLVRPNQRVVAERTILGTVRRERGHVHLTELDGDVVVNPLQPGHLTPYRDTTVPSVDAVSISDRAGRALDPLALTGTVALTAAAADTPPLPLPPPWTGVPVTPATVTWQLAALDGRSLVPLQVSADFAHTIPPPNEFWSVYSTGTYQNFPAVGQHYFYGTPGSYLFDLTPSLLDTRLVPPGRYVLTVVATDTCGNSGSASEDVRVLPQPAVQPLTGSVVETPRRRSLTALGGAGPRHFWTVVIGRVPDAYRRVARGALLLQPARRGPDLVVIGKFATWAEAYTAAQRLAPDFPGAYVREIALRSVEGPTAVTAVPRPIHPA